jgi:co-chaperonin GroES (HSP10)
VLVKPDPVEEVSKGGIILADTTRDRQKYAATKATFIEAGAERLHRVGLSGPQAAARRPGDVRAVQRRAQMGADGRDYVIMNDKDLLAVIEAAQ